MFNAPFLKKRLSEPRAYHGDWNDERFLKVLSKNAAIAGKIDLAKKILSASNKVEFSIGDKIILEGRSEDDVFYIISGKVEIRKNSQHCTFREASWSVGEMTALTPANPRSATVIVRGGNLIALKISGEKFRQITEGDSEFRERVQTDVTTRLGDRFKTYGQHGFKQGYFWVALSSCVAIVVCFLSYLLGKHFFATTLPIIILSGVIGVFSFVFVLMLNPLYRWLRLAFSSFMCAVGVIINFSLGLEFQFDNFGVKANKSTTMTETSLALVLVFFALIIVVGVIAYFKESRPKNS